MKQLFIEVIPKRKRMARKFKNAMLIGSGLTAFFGMAGFMEGRSYLLASICFVWLMILLFANSDLLEK